MGDSESYSKIVTIPKECLKKIKSDCFSVEFGLGWGVELKAKHSIRRPWYLSRCLFRKP
jgi:hypothetical protein